MAVLCTELLWVEMKSYNSFGLIKFLSMVLRASLPTNFSEGSAPGVTKKTNGKLDEKVRSPRVHQNPHTVI